MLICAAKILFQSLILRRRFAFSRAFASSKEIVRASKNSF